MAEEKQPEQAFGIIAQYVKDLSFENVTPITSIAPSNEQPQIDVQMKVNVEKSEQENTYNVSLHTNIQAQIKSGKLFVLELNYVGEFAVSGFAANITEQLLYIECPRMLFPFARSVIAHTVSEGGCPPLYLSPVDFVELYRQQKEANNQTLQ